MADNEGYIDVSFDQDGGVMKKILKEAPEGASGPPPRGNEVEAHYTGTFLLMSIVASNSMMKATKITHNFLGVVGCNRNPGQ